MNTRLVWACVLNSCSLILAFLIIAISAFLQLVLLCMQSVRNKFLRLCFMTLLATPWWLCVSAQVADSTNNQQLDDAKEILLQQQEQQSEEGDNNYEELEDALSYFSKHPIDLNRASDEELFPLVETGLMNELQLKEIISYRNLFGLF